MACSISRPAHTGPAGWPEITSAIATEAAMASPARPPIRDRRRRRSARSRVATGGHWSRAGRKAGRALSRATR